MSIKTTYNFIEKINNVNNEPGCKMILFDVKHFYTSIHKFDALNILKNKLISKYNFNPNDIHEIIQSIYVISNKNYFQHNYQLYTQKWSIKCTFIKIIFIR